MRDRLLASRAHSPRISFRPLADLTRGYIERGNLPEPDLVLVLYLDMMSEHPREVDALNAQSWWPWVGILFHPRLAERPGARVEHYFRAPTAQGAIFLVPKAIGAYQDACPSLHFALAPDVADLELAAERHPLAAELHRRAAGRKIVLLIGSVAAHKGTITYLDVVAGADPTRFFFAMVGEVHWSSFGEQEPRLRRFYANPPENVLLYEGYLESERDYNSILSTCDVLYAVYEGFNSSSNSLTKAAGFRRPILVPRGTLMGERVLAAGTGAVASSGDAADILTVLSALSDKELDDFDFSGYEQAHSLTGLKAALANAIPHWSAGRASNAGAPPRG